jgi:hypothetical protein
MSDKVIAVPVYPYAGTVNLDYEQFKKFVQDSFAQLNVPSNMTEKYLRSNGWSVSTAQNEMGRIATLMRSYGFPVGWAWARVPSDEAILNFFNSKC